MKRRKVAKKAVATVDTKKARPRIFDADFVPLFNGNEKPEFAAVRHRMFTESWAAIDARILNVLRDSNRSTLDAVASFVRDAPAEEPSKMPAALIVTGPNIASQDLLFEQLAERLGHDVAPGRCVRLRSAEAPNLKATLKKIIRDVTRQVVSDDDDGELAAGIDVRVARRRSRFRHADSIANNHRICTGPEVSELRLGGIACSHSVS